MERRAGMGVSPWPAAANDDLPSVSLRVVGVSLEKLTCRYYPATLQLFRSARAPAAEGRSAPPCGCERSHFLFTTSPKGTQPSATLRPADVGRNGGLAHHNTQFAYCSMPFEGPPFAGEAQRPTDTSTDQKAHCICECSSYCPRSSSSLPGPKPTDRQSGSKENQACIDALQGCPNLPLALTAVSEARSCYYCDGYNCFDPASKQFLDCRHLPLDAPTDDGETRMRPGGEPTTPEKKTMSFHATTATSAIRSIENLLRHADPRKDPRENSWSRGASALWSGSPFGDSGRGPGTPKTPRPTAAVR